MAEFSYEQIWLIRDAVKRAVTGLLEAQKHSSTTASPDANTQQVARFLSDAVAAICITEEYDESKDMDID